VSERRAGAIEVLVAEEHRLVRAGLRLLLEIDGDVVVVGEASRGEHALAGARTLNPDVVLIDDRVPGFGGLQTTRMISGLADVGVLLLLASSDAAQARAAVRAGVDGLLLRDGEPLDLLRAVRAVAAGDAFLAPPFTRYLVAALEGPRLGEELPMLEELTSREREVMALVAYGWSNPQIAARLDLSAATVKTHVARALAKLGVSDRAQLTALAYESGLIAPGGAAD
jgi:DNA-binding NarL/FixJ family response regulator